MPTPSHAAHESSQPLARALRAAASRASELAGGARVLVFAAGDASPHDLRLRSAAGFAMPEDARQAGAALAPHVRQSLADEGAGGTLPADVSMGAPGSGRVHVYPLRVDERPHGAIAIACREEPDDAAQRALGDVAENAALHLERMRLGEESARLREALANGAGLGGEKSDEVLRLSEALFAQDIELLRSNEKLGKIERLKNDFIEKMSRELRTPLNSIIEAIISVLTGEDETLSDSSKTALRSALDEGSAFLRTLQNILDLWRIKQGELPVEIQDVNFRELVDEAIFSVQDSLVGRPLRIETEFVEPFPRLRTDLTKLNQILFLLLENATKFTPEGVIRVRAQVHEGELVVSIQDDGIGICHDDQQYIFDEFYQVDEPSSQKYRGAGLGLTLVRDLVALLDGEISVKSDIGHGTTVSLAIPLPNA